ncbi:MAG: glycosyltransferase [Porticoccus sp.]|nr:glycosyltransferase [Porticoccus sp.]
MKKNILQVCHGYSAPFGDVARQWARLFDGSDYELTTIFLTGNKDEALAREVGGKVLFFEYTSRDLSGLKRGLVKRIKALHLQEHYEFCVAHRYKSIYSALSVKGLKVVGVNHAYGVYDKWLRRVLVMSQKSRLILVGVSSAIRDDIRKALPSFPAEQVQTVYNRINVKAIQETQVDRSSARKFLGVSNNGYVFGAVGRLHPDKDYKTLLSGFARVSEDMPDACLVIIGQGGLESRLKSQAEALGISGKVHFLGFVKDAYCYFKAFDSFVLSSDYEPFGMVLLEAMVAGLPIAYSNCGGSPEVVGSLGIPFSVNNPEELSRALLRLYTGQHSISCDQLIQRVNRYFSDEVVREEFWDLPALKKLLAGT